jgi:hypothetical protein
MRNAPVLRRLRPLVLTALPALLIGCGEEAPQKTGDNGQTCSCDGAKCGLDNCNESCGTCQGGEFCAEGACVDASGCDITGFETTNQAGFARFAGGQTRVRFVASNVEIEPPFDKLVVELNHARFFANATPSPGTFPLEGTSEVGAPLFVRGYTFCNDFDCAFPYVVEAGTLELEEAGSPGTRLSGWLRGLKLKQVRISDSTGEIIPFPSGKTWCVGDYRMDVEVPALSTAQGTCVEDGTGNNIGDNIRNFTLTNCYGEDVDLHQRCGKAKAVWIVATAGWCGACEQFVPVAGERTKARESEGLDLMVVIGENNASAAPSLQYCKDYAGAKGLDPAATFIDNDGQRSWPVLFDAINTYSGGSIGLPWNAVLDGRSMEYVWSSNAGSGDLYSVQDELLSRE